jgi:hypothetical protein
MEKHSAICEDFTKTWINTRHVLKSTAESDLLAALTTAVTGLSTTECAGCTPRVSQDQACRKEEYEPHEYGRVL